MDHGVSLCAGFDSVWRGAILRRSKASLETEEPSKHTLRISVYRLFHPLSATKVSRKPISPPTSCTIPPYRSRKSISSPTSPLLPPPPQVTKAHLFSYLSYPLPPQVTKAHLSSYLSYPLPPQVTKDHLFSYLFYLLPLQVTEAHLFSYFLYPHSHQKPILQGGCHHCSWMETVRSRVSVMHVFLLTPSSRTRTRFPRQSYITPSSRTRTRFLCQSYIPPSEATTRDGGPRCRK